MDTPTLERVIRSHIALSPRPNGRGFFSVLCRVCGDHGKKGKRAGFKFEGDSVGYNCFNCGHHAGFNPIEHETMPKDMVEVLTAFGIPNVDWEPVLFTSLVKRSEGGERKTRREKLLEVEPDVLTFPPFFYRLTNDLSDDWAQYSIEYLTARKVDWQSQPFYLVARVKEHPDNAKWYGRLIIPNYKDQKLIFWQGRDMTDLHIQKYLSPTTAKDRVLSQYRFVGEYGDEPLYVTEGWFDAYHINGVAAFGPILSEAQIRWLNMTTRPKVIIPDRLGDGHRLAEQAISLGWSVAFPDIGSCKDINDAIKKYGLLYTMSTIREHTASGFEAQARVGIYCERDYSKEKDKKPPR